MRFERKLLLLAKCRLKGHVWKKVRKNNTPHKYCPYCKTLKLDYVASMMEINTFKLSPYIPHNPVVGIAMEDMKPGQPVRIYTHGYGSVKGT